MELWKDGFNHYGSGNMGRTNMLSGAWADAPTTVYGAIATPPWGARTGSFSLYNHIDGGGYRRTLPANKPALIVACAISCAFLPGGNNRATFVSFRSAGNDVLYKLVLQSNGALDFQTAAGVSLGATQGPVISPQTWYFIEMKVDRVAQTFELRMGDPATSVISLTGLTLPATDIGQLVVLQGNSTGGDGELWMADLIVRDTSGTRNNGFEGDIRVATLFANADTNVAGWTPRPRKKFGTGILDNRAANNACVTAASSTNTNLGSGDFTIEQMVRFYALPSGANKAQLFGKWDETNNRRSYQLYIGGPTLANGNLVFRTSTDGQAGTVTEVISWPWVPDLNRWYHVAISRASGETMLFVDGVQLGLPIADAATYFAGTAPTAIGAQCEGVSNALANTAFNGFIDEVRLTVGSARYTGPFAPPTVAFPRSVGGDPSFANVVLLCGFDSGVNDESSFGRLLTARNGAVMHTPDDGVAAYQTINQHVPRDDTFVEAALIAASSVLTFGALPTASKTVTVGTKDGVTAAAYKFVTVLAAAFDVLIGVDIPTSIANLVAAINAGAGSGVTYGTGTTANYDVFATQLPGAQLSVAALTPGTGGNSITTTTTDLNASWTGATLAGGQNIPGPSEFMFDRPPPETTVIKSVSIVTRNFKSDAGTCSMQVSFVGPHGAATAGADASVSVNPSYREDVFEIDPDTSGAITPTTIVSGRARLNRTA